MKKNSDYRNPIPAKLLFSLLAMWLLFFAPGNLQCRLFPGMPGGNGGGGMLFMGSEFDQWIGIGISGAFVVLVSITFSAYNHPSFLKRNIIQALLIAGFLLSGNSISGKGGNVIFPQGPAAQSWGFAKFKFVTESIKALFLIFGFVLWHGWKRSTNSATE